MVRTVLFAAIVFATAYKQKCEFRTREGGHRLMVKQPKGLKLKVGDLVTMYATVEGIKRQANPVRPTRRGP
ncbi:MAG: hypothetical protein AAFY60_04555 [Myxococcota bacterium]